MSVALTDITSLAEFLAAFGFGVSLIASPFNFAVQAMDKKLASARIYIEHLKAEQLSDVHIADQALEKPEAAYQNAIDLYEFAIDKVHPTNVAAALCAILLGSFFAVVLLSAALWPDAQVPAGAVIMGTVAAALLYGGAILSVHTVANARFEKVSSELAKVYEL
ncbi:MAG: hypothetical protein U9P68_12055 [Pseudomonadota bacterium]|nr:hypothetical protein [Pseudomonadota bacterium]